MGEYPLEQINHDYAYAKCPKYAGISGALFASLYDMNNANQLFKFDKIFVGSKPCLDHAEYITRQVDELEGSQDNVSADPKYAIRDLIRLMISTGLSTNPAMVWDTEEAIW